MQNRTFRSVAIVIGFGAGYLIIGRASGAAAAAASTQHDLENWRRMAFIVSAIAFAVHFGLAYRRDGAPPFRTALQCASAVGLGAFGLAVAALIHDHEAGRHTQLLGLSLVLWPLLMGVPAFLVAFAG